VRRAGGQAQRGEDREEALHFDMMRLVRPRSGIG
jgi:hypothetical protein